MRGGGHPNIGAQPGPICPGREREVPSRTASGPALPGRDLGLRPTGLDPLISLLHLPQSPWGAFPEAEGRGGSWWPPHFTDANAESARATGSLPQGPHWNNPAPRCLQGVEGGGGHDTPWGSQPAFTGR